MYILLGLFLLISFSVFAKEPLSLKQAEEIAISENKTVQATRQLLEKAKQGKLESYSKWLPQLRAISEAYITSIKQNPFVNSRTSFITQISLSQTIFSSDDYYDIKIAELYVKQLKLLLEAAINDVLFQVRSVYYLVLLDQRNILTARENIALFSSLAKKMIGNYKAGLAIQYDVNQSKVIVANALTRYYQAVKSLKVDRDLLTEALGFEPGSRDFEITEKIFPLESIPDIASKLQLMAGIFVQPEYSLDNFYADDFTGLQERQMTKLFSQQETASWERLAEMHRPSLLISANELSISNEIVHKKVGKYLPQVGLSGSYGGEPVFFLFEPRKNFGDQAFDWGLTVSFSWDIFDGLKRERQLSQARYQRGASSFNYQNAMLEAFADVRKQIFSIEESIASYLSSKGNIDLARETVELAKERLEVGYVTIYDYQISVDGLIQARFNLDQSEYDILLAYYALRHATGIDANNYL